MRKPGLISIAAAAVTAAVALPTAAQAAPACAPVPTTYDGGGAPTSSSPNDPLLSRQWGLNQIKAAGAWSRGALGAGTTIAVVDTGVDLNHPDLQGRLLPGVDMVTDETWAELSARWSVSEVFELICTSLSYRVVSGILNSTGVQLDDGVPGWPSPPDPPG